MSCGPAPWSMKLWGRLESAGPSIEELASMSDEDFARHCRVLEETMPKEWPALMPVMTERIEVTE